MPDNIKTEASAAMTELLESANLARGSLVVVGCSTSEIVGKSIGSAGSTSVACDLFEAFSPLLAERGLFLGAQCCEHLNRAVVLEREACSKFGLEEVSVRPVPKAGGAFASAVFEGMSDPVVVENVRADAGLDIGGTMIGMQLKAVAVPLRLKANKIGAASVTGAKTRPKLIGGARASYPEV